MVLLVLAQASSGPGRRGPGPRVLSALECGVLNVLCVLYSTGQPPKGSRFPLKLKRFLDFLRVRFQAFSVGELSLTRRGREFRAIPSSRRAVERTRETKQSNSSETVRK